MATILVVDDRPLNREFLVTLLGYAGHRTLEARDGAEALQRVEAERPDLIITDILMPTMDGYELVRRLRAVPHLAGIPVIFYTATYRAREARALAESCGVAAVLSKPSEPAEILKTVQAVLGVVPDVPTPLPAPAAEVLSPAWGGETARISGQLKGYLDDVEAVHQLMTRLVERGQLLTQERDQLPEIVERLSRAVDHLQSVSLRLATLVELSLELSAQREPERLLEIFCRAAHDIGVARYTAVGIAGADGQGLRHFHTRGYDDETLARLGPFPRGGLLGQSQTAHCPQYAGGGVDCDPQRLGLPAAHPPVRSFLSVPVASPSQTYGWLYLADKLGAEQFSEADQDMALTLATQVAIAYENLLFYDELQQRGAQLQMEVAERRQAQESLRRMLRARAVMAESNRVLVRAQDEKDLLDGVCQTVVRIGGYPMAWIGWAGDDPEKSISPAAWTADEGRDFDEYRFTWADGEAGATPAGIAIRSGQVFVAGDLETAAVCPAWRQAALGRGYRSAVSLPLAEDSRAVGALTLLAGEAGGFGDEEIALLKELADDIAYGVRYLRNRSALRITQARFANILDVAYDAIISIDENQRIVLFNKGAERIFGYAEAEVLGMPLDILLPEDVRERHRRHIADYAVSPSAARRMGQYLEVSGQSKDGRIFPAETAISQIKSDGGIIFTAIVRDVTERKRAEQVLREREVRFHAVAQSAPDAFISADAQGNIVFWNEGARRIFGYLEEEVLGQPLTLLMPARFRKAHLQGLRRFNASGEARVIGKTLEFAALRKGGEEFPIDLSLAQWFHLGQVFFTAIVRDITERKRYQARIEYLANHDALTGLPNRNLLSDRFGQALTHVRRSGRLLALLFLDLDRFKDVNDSYGHTLGDALLKAVAAKLMEAVREGDTVARQGGDEFIVLLSDVNRAEDLLQVADKLLRTFSEPFVVQGHELYLGSSIGASLCPDDGDDIATLLKNADTAMYRAKAQGGNAIRLYAPEMGEKAVERVEMENALRRGLEHGEFVLHYQPKVDLASGAIIGAEALIRWRHPEAGLIAPVRFIPVAEATGLIVPLGLWVLRAACGQNKLWQDAGLPPIMVAVNLSAGQLRKEDLTAAVDQALDESGLEPRFLELELTESMVMENPEQMIVILKALKARGVRLSLDDFGTGYSSLSYLKRFPFDLLKIDQSFVRDIPADADDAVIAQTVISLGHSLGLKVIAEGVETAEQLAFLQCHGCDEIQGYYFSRPVPAEEFVRLLARGERLHLPPAD